MSCLRSTLAVTFLTVLVVACAPQIREPEPRSAVELAPANFPHRDYEQAAAQGKTVYRIDPARSLVTVTVRRGGSLARLGHDHVVASHKIQGYISPEANRADLYFRLSELSVDEPLLRVEAGMDTQPSDSDIAGTRINMLDKVIDAREFPFAFINVRGLEKLNTGVRLTVAITLHGVTRAFEVPAQMQAPPDAMNVTGSLELNQSDFGIVPFSILGGAIQVQDRLSLRFNIYARVGYLPNPSAS